MPDVIASTPEFREHIIAVLIYTDWLLRYGPIIKPEFFPVEPEEELVSIVNNYYEQYKDAPTEIELRELISDSNTISSAFLDSVFSCSDSNLTYAATKALEFAQSQAMKIAIWASVESIKKGDLNKPLELVKEAQAIGSDRLALGMELIEDAESWVYEELHGRRFPTGIPKVDNILGGGMVAGEYLLVMAPPGKGKTTLLINIGFAWAGLTSAGNVLHVTYEMPAQKVLKRYAARVAGIRLRRGHGAEEKFIKDLRQNAKQRLKGKLRVIRPIGNTVNDIRRTIDNLSSEGFFTEALIVDYPDLMTPVRKRKEYRFELADIARDLRDLGSKSEYNIPVGGATQAGRQAFYKEIVQLRDIAEAIEKAGIADIVIAICQTREEEKLKQGRLFLAKIRDGEDKFIVPVKLDFEKQIITQRGKLDL